MRSASNPCLPASRAACARRVAYVLAGIEGRVASSVTNCLMRVAISIKEGRLNSVTMLRRLTSNSRRNEIYKAFREVGRSVRTVQLLRFLADAGLRRRVTELAQRYTLYPGL